MSHSAAGAELVIRPCREEYKQMLKATPIFFLVFVLLLVLRQGVAGLVAAVVTTSVCAVVMHFYFRGVHVVVTRNEIGRSGFTSRRTMRPRSEVATLITATMPLSALDARMADNLIVLDRRGRRILRLRSTHWAREDMTRVIEHLGIQPISYDRIVTASELGRSYPRALPWIERRPIQSAIVLALGVFAAAILVVVLIVAFSGS